MGLHGKSDGVRQMMRTAAVAALALWAAPLAAQAVIGARAGVVSFAVGKVYLDNEGIAISATHFPEIKEKSVLRTEGGRAEVLLNPCAMLRVDEDSSVRLLDSSLLEPRVELLSGSAVVDVPGIKKGSQIRVQLSGAAVEMSRKGLYRFDLSPGLVKVFEGRATVERSTAKLDVANGKMLALDSSAAEKFDPRDGDGLDLWNHQRSLVLARARNGRQMSMVDLAAEANRAIWTDAGVGRGGGMDTGEPAIIRPPRMGSAPATLRRAPLDTGCKF